MADLKMASAEFYGPKQLALITHLGCLFLPPFPIPSHNSKLLSLYESNKKKSLLLHKSSSLLVAD